MKKLQKNKKWNRMAHEMRGKKYMFINLSLKSVKLQCHPGFVLKAVNVYILNGNTLVLAQLLQQHEHSMQKYDSNVYNHKWEYY